MDDDSTYERFTTEIAGARVLARVPVAAKKTCERLMRKSDHNEDEGEYLHENYWVKVHYRGQLYGYKGTDDIWTYSARDLPDPGDLEFSFIDHRACETFRLEHWDHPEEGVRRVARSACFPRKETTSWR